jgi:hypothetical protein
MAKSWIALRVGWKLEDVQAALNVIISVLSTLGIFVFARFCWHGTAAQVGRSQNVRLSSLLSLSTPGEVFDVILLLKFKLLSSPYLKLFAQSVVVITLSTTAVLSGPITRFSTRHGYTVTPIEVPGSLATNQFNSISYANVEWDQIQTSLNGAGFPTNQLLDFLPNTSIDWIYRPEEWNSTWSLTCEPTPSTPFTVTDTGNCSYLAAEMPALQDILPAAFRDDWYYADAGFYVNHTLWKDMLMFIVAPLYTDFDDKTNTTYAMNISIASIHLSHVQKQLNDSSDCLFGAGNVKQASYTRIDCGLTRPRHIPDETHRANPGSGDVSNIPWAYEEYYQARFTQESTSNSEITVITPSELVRFYQAYVISKDTMYRQPVTRTLSVEIPIVELSTAFLTVCLLAAFLLAAGLTKYIFFMLRHQTTMLVTPESKLDWMLQSIKEAPASSPVVRYDRFRRSEKSFSSITSEDLSDVPKGGSLMKAEFEAATFGSLDPELQMLGQKRVRRGSTLIGDAAMAGRPGNRRSWMQQLGGVDQAKSHLLHGQHPAFANHESCCGR